MRTTTRAGWLRAQAIPSLVGLLGSRRARPTTVLLLAWLVGSIPSSYLVARILRGVDLRSRGNGTVSGTALFEVAGFRPLAASGLFEMGKGALGPVLAGRERPFLGAASVALATMGHNWSPFLGGKGGRGSSVALGCCAVAAPEGVVILGLGMGLGRAVRETGIGNLLALVTLLPLLTWTRGRQGGALACAMVVPAIAKRLLGNDGRLPIGRRALLERLLFDRDLA